MQVVKHWAALSPRIEPSALKEAWDKMEAHIMSPGGKPWARVKGPMAATFMHLREMGWTAHFTGSEHDGFMDQNGTLWKFNHEISWQDFDEHIQEIREQHLWTQASHHRGGQGMENGVDMSVPIRHYNRLVKNGQTDKAPALASINAGALWCPARLEEAGIKNQDGSDVHKCPLCGAPSTNEGHLFWECPKVLQNKDVTIQKTNRYCSEYHRTGLDKKCYWWRGLQPVQMTTPIHKLVASYHRVGTPIREYRGEDNGIH